MRAKVMSYTSSDGVVHPQSFWVMAGYGVRPTKKEVEFRFVGYHDQAAYLAQTPVKPIHGARIAVRNSTNPQYNVIFNPNVNGKIDDPVIAGFALAVGAGHFAGATDVDF